MFKFSSKTMPVRQYSLTRLLQLIKAGKEVKEDAKGILSITISNVLNNTTMNFTTESKVREIYIFKIVLSSKNIPTLLISALDKTFEQNNLYCLQHENETAFYGAFKQRTEKGNKIGKYYLSEWKSDYEPAELPVNINSIDSVYTAIIDELIPITATEGEQTEEFVVRYDKICKLKKEIQRLQKLVDGERQPKKRFELNAKLKELKAEVDKLEGK